MAPPLAPPMESPVAPSVALTGDRQPGGGYGSQAPPVVTEPADAGPTVGVSVVWALCALAARRRSGGALIWRDGATGQVGAFGEVYFDHGRIVAASCWSLGGAAALAAIVHHLPVGQLRFLSGVTPEQRNLDLAPEALSLYLPGLDLLVVAPAPAVASTAASGTASVPAPVLPPVPATAHGPDAGDPASGPPAPALAGSSPGAADADGTTVCPHLGFADDPAAHYSRPVRLHRCYALERGVAVSLDEQRALCLTARFGACRRLAQVGGAPASEALAVGVVAPAAGGPTARPEPVPLAVWRGAGGEDAAEVVPPGGFGRASGIGSAPTTAGAVAVGVPSGTGPSATVLRSPLRTPRDTPRVGLHRPVRDGVERLAPVAGVLLGLAGVVAALALLGGQATAPPVAPAVAPPQREASPSSSAPPMTPPSSPAAFEAATASPGQTSRRSGAAGAAGSAPGEVHALASAETLRSSDDGMGAGPSPEMGVLLSTSAVSGPPTLLADADTAHPPPDASGSAGLLSDAERPLLPRSGAARSPLAVLLGLPILGVGAALRRPRAARRHGRRDVAGRGTQLKPPGTGGERAGRGPGDSPGGAPGGAADQAVSSESAAETSPILMPSVVRALREPLLALGTASTTLLEDVAAGVDGTRASRSHLRRQVATLHGQAVQLQWLVEHVLCAATLQQGRLSLRMLPISLLEVIDEVRQAVQPLLTQRAQWLRLHWRRPLPDPTADGRRLGQVLINLLVNASSAGPAGGPIDVTLTVRPGVVRVTVADRGPGLPPGPPARLFEPFVASSIGAAAPGGSPLSPGAPGAPGGSPLSPGAPGAPVQVGAVAPRLGLGLTIVKAIVERHHGRLGASNRRGGGARFWFELPYTRPSGDPGAGSGGGSQAPAAAMMTGSAGRVMSHVGER